MDTKDLSNSMIHFLSPDDPETIIRTLSQPQIRIVSMTITKGGYFIDPEFSQWIIDNVAFPNSTVDRITPATGDREWDILVRDFGIEGNCPVFCEDFIQWV